MSRASRSGRFLSRAALVLGAVALACLAAELVVRVAYADFFDKMLRVPFEEVEEVSDVEGVRFLYRPSIPGKTNNVGLRNAYDIQPEKPADVLRVLVVGDSVTDGIGLPPDPTALFTGRLEARLQAHFDRPVQVLNLSLAGLSLRQELTLVERRGLDLQPDLVVFAFCANDGVETALGAVPNIQVARWSKLLALVQLSRWQRAIQADDGDPFGADSPARRNLDAAFDELALLSRSVPTAVAVLPIITRHEGDQYHREFVLNACSARNLACLDLWSELKGHDLFDYRLVPEDEHDVLHFNHAGHAAIAAALERLLLPLIPR